MCDECRRHRRAGAADGPASDRCGGPFRGVHRGGGIDCEAGIIFREQHLRFTVAIYRNVARRRQTSGILLDCRGLRDARLESDHGGRSVRSYQSVWRVESDGGKNAALVRFDPRAAEYLSPVLQRLGRRAAGRLWRRARSGDTPDPAAAARGEVGQARHDLRRRLPDAGRHLHPRLYPCDRPGGRARGGA